MTSQTRTGFVEQIRQALGDVARLARLDASMLEAELRLNVGRAARGALLARR